MLGGIEGAGGDEDGACRPLLAGEGLATELGACGTTGLRTSLYSSICYSQNIRKAQEMPSLLFSLLRKLKLT